jgi:hypothetical protein
MANNKKTKQGGSPPPVSSETKKPKNKKKKEKVVYSAPPNEPKRVTQAKGAADGYYAYQDDVTEEDPLKDRALSHTMEYIVTNIATPEEMANGKALSGVEKGTAVYFVPPAANSLGTFVGKKEASSEFFNDSDQVIIVAGAWCKNWSEKEGIVDTVEPFRLEIPPRSSKKTFAERKWNWPLFAADGSSGAPARYMMMRYYVHSSDAWSAKYEASAVTTDGQDAVYSAMKEVTAYRRVDEVKFYTSGGVKDDEDPTNLLGIGTFANFADIHLVNGTEPFPPMPYKMHELTGRIAGTKKKIKFFGVPKNGYRAGSSPVFQDVVVDLSNTDKIGLGTYPVDYYDDDYGWGGCVTLCSFSKSDITDNKPPGIWLNTYTSPNMAQNMSVEWELPSLASLSMDESNTDSCFVGGRFKYSDELGCYVLWDYMRNKPSLVGWGYGSFDGDYIFYGPKCFTSKQTVVRGVVPPPHALGARLDDDGSLIEPPLVPPLQITWGAVFSIVCTIIEVIYVASQALGAHLDREQAMLRFIDPKAYRKQQRKIEQKGQGKLQAFVADQDWRYGKLKPPRPPIPPHRPLDLTTEAARRGREV